MADDGSIVIAWASGEQDGSDFGVYAQRYAADGAPLGEEFRVNTSTADWQRSPSVGVDADGDFVIAWTGKDPNSVFGNVYAQRYRADGEPAGDEFQVNVSLARGFHRSPSVGMRPDGGFVIAWVTNEDNPFGNIYMQQYDANGQPESVEARAVGVTSGSNHNPTVGVAPNGNVVIAWDSDPMRGDLDIVARRFDAEGVGLGGTFTVNTLTADDQLTPSVAVDASGNFVIAWVSTERGASRSELFAQRFASDGTPLGGQIQVSPGTQRQRSTPVVDTDKHGNFLVAWHSSSPEDEEPNDSEHGIYARRYASKGTPLAPPFQVNSVPLVGQQFLSLGMSDTGDLVVAWDRGAEDTTDSDILARRFSTSPVANEDAAPRPTTLALDAVFPNPVRDAATLRYALPTTAAVRLTVTDVLGRTVLSRAEGVQPAEQHEARLSLADLPSGVYIVRLDADGVTATQRVTVVR